MATNESVDSVSILDQDDAKLGLAVRRALLDMGAGTGADGKQGDALITSIAAAYALIEHALKVGADQSSVALRGVTFGNEAVGNWTVTVRQWDAADAESLPPAYLEFTKIGIEASAACKEGRLVDLAALAPELIRNGQAMLRSGLDMASALNKLREEMNELSGDLARERIDRETDRQAMVAKFKTERDLLLHWQDPEDRPLPEDAAIAADFPTTSSRPDSHDLYAEALRLVGARHSKRSLVMLVTWLLAERARAREASSDIAIRLPESLEQL